MGQGPDKIIRKKGILKIIVPEYEKDTQCEIKTINRTAVYWKVYQQRIDDIPQQMKNNKTHTDNHSKKIIIDIKELLDFLRDPMITDMLIHFRPYMDEVRQVTEKRNRKRIVLEAITTYLAQNYD
ncbi:hypothetical protein PR048_005999 [Dryococelus australis]|uniref:Uncharacterized protein n=1 Tax=Dryococelus australis TaxID=614101 RepID=A0ABQ9IBX4_9NEOP|nr:hypothetical protein PR048_005999 [Dryococelus australis]